MSTFLFPNNFSKEILDSRLYCKKVKLIYFEKQNNPDGFRHPFEEQDALSQRRSETLNVQTTTIISTNDSGVDTNYPFSYKLKALEYSD